MIVSEINNLHDRFTQAISQKCWNITKSMIKNKNENDSHFQENVAIYLDAKEFPVGFEMGSFLIRKKSVLTALVVVCLYCMHILIVVKSVA